MRGEDINTATGREVLEETGVTIEPVAKIGEKLHPHNPAITLLYIHCNYVSGTAMVCEPDKHEAVTWMKPAELADLFERDYTPFVRDFFEQKQ